MFYGLVFSFCSWLHSTFSCSPQVPLKGYSMFTHVVFTHIIPSLLLPIHVMLNFFLFTHFQSTQTYHPIYFELFWQTTMEMMKRLVCIEIFNLFWLVQYGCLFLRSSINHFINSFALSSFSHTFSIHSSNYYILASIRLSSQISISDIWMDSYPYIHLFVYISLYLCIHPSILSPSHLTSIEFLTSVRHIYWSCVSRLFVQASCSWLLSFKDHPSIHTFILSLVNPSTFNFSAKLSSIPSTIHSVVTSNTFFMKSIASFCNSSFEWRVYFVTTDLGDFFLFSHSFTFLFIRSFIRSPIHPLRHSSTSFYIIQPPA